MRQDPRLHAALGRIPRSVADQLLRNLDLRRPFGDGALEWTDDARDCVLDRIGADVQRFLASEQRPLELWPRFASAVAQWKSRSGMMAVFIVHTERNNGTILDALGTADYSYYFVSRAFHHVLDHLGTVIDVEDGVVEGSSDGAVEVVHDVRGQVDAIYEICRHVGEPCLFLSFAPPHRTPLDLECPTIPVFAWEFPDIPNESWDGEPRHDWRFVLGKTGLAITHSGIFGARGSQCSGRRVPCRRDSGSPSGSAAQASTTPSDTCPILGARTVEIAGGTLDTRSSAPQQEGAPRAGHLRDRSGVRWTSSPHGDRR